MKPSTPLLIATSNLGKFREIQSMLSDLPLCLKGLSDIAPCPPPVEDAGTFTGNAEKKAMYYADRTGMTTLADDSGLEVDALGGQPGVISARFAGELAGDAANNAKLLDLLQDVPDERRTARFRCAMVLAGPAGVLARAEGAVEGQILRQPRGTAGFGYDPLFWIPTLGRSAAELEPGCKNRISHRGKALQNLLGALQEMTSS